MISPFFPGVFFDSTFSPDDSPNIDLEIQRIHRLCAVSGTALWFQKFNMVYLTETWHTIFGVPPDEMFLLEDYLVLIEDEQERNRIGTARESLISRSPGFKWCDAFTLCDRKVQSFAVVAECCIFGLDRVVG